jgi:hypothetical protein
LKLWILENLVPAERKEVRMKGVERNSVFYKDFENNF